MKWFLTAFGKYADFSGRAGRSEYWYFFLFAQIVFPLGLALFVNIFGVIALLGGESQHTVVPATEWLLFR